MPLGLVSIVSGSICSSMYQIKNPLIPAINDFFLEFVKKIQNGITNRIIGRTFIIAKVAAAYHLWKPIMAVEYCNADTGIKYFYNYDSYA